MCDFIWDITFNFSLFFFMNHPIFYHFKKNIIYDFNIPILINFVLFQRCVEKIVCDKSF